MLGCMDFGYYDDYTVLSHSLTNGISKDIPLGLDQLEKVWEEQRQSRGW